MRSSISGWNAGELSLSNGLRGRRKWSYKGIARMHICACGGQIRRIHRNLPQKLEYMAIYRCAGCGEVHSKPWAYMFYFGSHTRCPI